MVSSISLQSAGSLLSIQTNIEEMTKISTREIVHSANDKILWQLNHCQISEIVIYLMRIYRQGERGRQRQRETEMKRIGPTLYFFKLLNLLDRLFTSFLEAVCRFGLSLTI